MIGRLVSFSLLAFSTGTALAGPKHVARQSTKTEVLTCRNGTEDRHARIAVVLLGGKVDSFAYYSKWKPRTCSIYLQRQHDPHSRWRDQGNVTTVSVERGVFLIEQQPSAYRFVFRDIDRERYCGMDGTINGTLTIHKNSERCELSGVMEEGVPLGQAVAYMQRDAVPPGTGTSAAPPVAVVRAPSVATRDARAASPPQPSSGVLIGD